MTRFPILKEIGNEILGLDYDNALQPKWPVLIPLLMFYTVLVYYYPDFLYKPFVRLPVRKLPVWIGLPICFLAALDIWLMSWVLLNGAATFKRGSFFLKLKLSPYIPHLYFWYSLFILLEMIFPIPGIAVYGIVGFSTLVALSALLASAGYKIDTHSPNKYRSIW